MRIFGFSFNRSKDQLSRFERLSLIAEGGMSKVYRCRDRESDKIVALKVLKPETAEWVQQFKKLWRAEEGKIALRLNDPNVVHTLDYGHTEDNTYWISMEFVDAPNLKTLLGRSDPQVKERRLDIVLQSGRALSYIHREGLIHRDFCPKNILFDTQGVVKIIDFGLTVPVSVRLKKGMGRSGTASYMAPEQIRRVGVDQRADIYAFGISAFEILTGRFPFPAARSRARRLEQQLNIELPPLSEVDSTVPPGVHEVIEKCVEKDPDSRYNSMGDVMIAIRRAMGMSPG